MTLSAIRSVDHGLWVLDKHFVITGCRASVRMTILRVGDGLMLYSPVEMTGDERAAVNALGTVHAIVAPNLYHHLFLRAAVEAWPAARVFVPEGLDAKIGAIPRAEVMGPQTDFGGSDALEFFVFSGHAIHETIFRHVPTKTLISSDLIYNYSADQFPAEKLFFRCLGCFGSPNVPFYHRFAIRDRTSLTSLMEWVQEREIRRLIMSHGRIYDGEDAGALFRRVWSRFG